MGEISRFLLKYPLGWSILFAAVGFVTSYIYVDKLPDPIPLHWDPDGQPDGYLPRSVGVLLLPSIGTLVSLFVQVGVWLDKSNREHSDKSKLAINASIILPSVVLLGLHVVVIQTATLDDATLAAYKLFTLIGLLLVACGFILKSVEPNYIVGIRDKWTLESQRVWDATHVFAYRAFFGAGLLCFVLLWIVPPGLLEEVALILLVLVPALAAVVYSYIIRDRPTYSAAHWDAITGAEPLLAD